MSQQVQELLKRVRKPKRMRCDATAQIILNEFKRLTKHLEGLEKTKEVITEIDKIARPFCFRLCNEGYTMSEAALMTRNVI
jgi:hypothetical protein